MMSSMDMLASNGLVGDYNPQLAGIFSSIVGGIFGGGTKEKEKIIEKAPKPHGGGAGAKFNPTTVLLVAGGALAIGALLMKR